MNRHLCAVATVAALSTCVAGTAHAHSANAAGVRSCHTMADATIVISSARNMTCKSAKREIRRYRGSIKRHFDTPGGFSCKRVSGGRLAGQWRCVKGSRAFRFDFSD